MNGEELKTTKTQLALALAQGASVTAWARARDVPKMTDYRWLSGVGKVSGTDSRLF
jgi:hypothetical protein